MIPVDRYTPSPQTAVRLGIDFGTGTLVIGISKQEFGGYSTLAFPGWSQEQPGRDSGGPVHTVPVLIHYGQDGGRTIGDEVVRAGNAHHPQTARWIRKYLLEESPVRIAAGTDRRITFRDAATDFLGDILTRASRDCPGCSSVVFAIPPDAPAGYAGWLGDIARAAGIRSWHTLPEPAAVIAGYGLVPEPGQVYLILRWDETDFSASFVRSEKTQQSPAGELQVTGTACTDTGCNVLDGWIAQDVLARSHLNHGGGKAQRICEEIAGGIRELYRQLATENEGVIRIDDPRSGTPIPVRVSREDISRILTEHGFPPLIDRTTGRARAAACSHGCGEEQPAAILLTGRGCAIPVIRDLVTQQWAGVPILSHHPLDAAARGAALFFPRANLPPDRIKNDYALRYWDPKSREHRYRFLVRSGARYPSAGQVARITISAAYDGQTRLGIPLYEISTASDAEGPTLELVSDPAGGCRLAGPPENAGAGHRPHLANERTPTLLAADPPALKGEPRFELTFVLDRERQLCVTARDLVTGRLVKKDAPVHRLT